MAIRDETVIRLKAVMGLPIFKSRHSYRTVWNWRKYGVNGVRLECFREGRAVFTSVEAVARFLESINVSESNGKIRSRLAGR